MPYKREGSSNWWITVDGVRKSSGTRDYESAKALEAKLNHQQWLHQMMGIKPPKSWAEAAQKFIAESQHKASIDTIKQRLGWWLPFLGSVEDIRQIDREMIDTLIQRHREVTGKPSSANATANKYAIVVGSVLNAACEEWRWIESVPKFRRYPELDHRRMWLKVHQWRRLEATLPDHLREPATLALATGLRCGKVFGLTWNQVDLYERSIEVRGNRFKRGVTLPLNRTASSLLEAILARSGGGSDRVFLYRGKPLADYGQAWYRALDRVGLQGFPWHGFRHTFASWLGKSGVSDTVLDLLCGWAEKDTRSIYTHRDIEDLRRYTEIIDAQLATHPPLKVSEYFCEEALAVAERTGLEPATPGVTVIP